MRVIERGRSPNRSHEKGQYKNNNEGLPRHA